MQRVFTDGAKTGKKVCLKGWIDQIRDLGRLKFFILKDREGSIQVTLKKDVVVDSLFSLIEGLHREDCVEVAGSVKKSEQAPDGREVVPDSIKVVSRAKTPLPFETREMIKTGIDKRFDFRFLDLRDAKTRSIFGVRSRIFSAIREYFRGKGFVEVHTPVIQAAGAEGGATMFSFRYYNRKAFLRQSPQLYKQMLMASTLDRVYEIGPAFRAEQFHTRRHLSEFMSVDFEMAWIESEDDVMKVVEGMIVHVLRDVKKNCVKEMEVLKRKIDVPEIPFKRITYDEALDILKKNGVSVKWGEDLEDAQEKVLGDVMAKRGYEWFFITKYPSKIKPFYIMMEGKYSRGIDLSNRGMEIASGGQREHRVKELEKMIKAKGLNPDDFRFYLDAFSYGMPPHGGIGLGGDRLVQQIAGAENIKEVVLFPRTTERMVP
jgi:aspartyl-tRNA synthetase